jgi:hypothetical protein
MDTVIAFASLAIETLVALFAALALQMVLLKATFLLMSPATADRRPDLQRGTQLVARIYARSK